MTGLDQRSPKLRARVVQCLINRAARTVESLSENIDRNVIHRHALKDQSLSLGQLLIHGLAQRCHHLVVLEALQDWRRGVGKPIPYQVVELDPPFSPRRAPQAGGRFVDRKLACPGREPGVATVGAQLGEDRHQGVVRGLNAKIVAVIGRSTLSGGAAARHFGARHAKQEGVKTRDRVVAHPVVTLESAQPFGGLLVKLESVHLRRRRRLARDPYVNVSGGARLSLGLGRVARALLAESFAADPPSNSQMLEGNEYRI